jgi:carboxypeptidase C (cathepsin A)
MPQASTPSTSPRQACFPSPVRAADACRQKCDGPLCYAAGKRIADYLNEPATRKLLGVEAPRNFSGCDAGVSAAFNRAFDKFGHPTQYHVAGLLDRGVRMLIYAGTYDWQCNWVRRDGLRLHAQG